MWSGSFEELCGEEGMDEAEASNPLTGLYT